MDKRQLEGDKENLREKLKDMTALAASLKARSLTVSLILLIVFVFFLACSFAPEPSYPTLSLSITASAAMIFSRHPSGGEGQAERAGREAEREAERGPGGSGSVEEL